MPDMAGEPTLRALWADEGGPTAVEYALMLGGVALAIVITVATLGDGVRGLFDSVVTLWP